ncbi:hypothetical protein IAF28_20720, partial [Acinetobacter baumannii]|nr:hypothetical protein [Acinetobacter baumannii]
GKQKQFNHVLALLNTLDAKYKQRIMLTLLLPENNQQNAWQEVAAGCSFPWGLANTPWCKSSL